ncbi:MAG: h16, partial [Frondihabitans sp.]|nr:h16 [Frondihabitans sp.]
MSRLRDQFTTTIRTREVNQEEFRAHVKVAETWVLLACAVLITGDRNLLAQYLDRVGKPASLAVFKGVTAGDAGDPAARAELVDLLANHLADANQIEYFGTDDHEVMGLINDLAAGFAVPRDQLKMNLQQSGFVPDDRSVPPTKTPAPTLDVAIIGAGMTGIDAAVKAKDRGFSFAVYELEDGPGGLWWSQRYPGVGVDTPALFYSLSWHATPDWSLYYPKGEEYRAYLISIVEKYDLHDHLHFASKVTRLRWLDDENRWEITITSTVDHSTTVVTAATVITAAGNLNRAKYPDVSGIETFAGRSVHTANWEETDLSGKRVGVVGVGAAGVQVIASIAPIAEHVTVFQRQAHWISPNFLGDGVVTDDEKWLRRHLPFYLQLLRLSIFSNSNLSSRAGNAVDEEWLATHGGLSVSEDNESARLVCLNYINEVFGEGSELAEKLTPHFAFGGKRPVRDPADVNRGGYYWAYLQPHVDLVTEPISSVVPEGILTADGELVELDEIIWASGMTLDYLSTIEIIGREGRILGEIWGDDPRTFLGGTVPGFPNLFVQDGPNTGVANGGGG